MLKQIEIGYRRGDEEGAVYVEVIYSGRKSLGLEVSAQGRVTARVPYGTSDRLVMDFVKSRQEWIVHKWFLMGERQREKESRPPRDYELDPSLEQVYRRQAEEKLRERTAYFAEKMGVTYGRITIRAAKTRWGSCSSKGNLNFHWKLILMPEPVLDYVVVHELAHRKEMNHSPRFWREVERILPDWRERRKWLKSIENTV